MHILILFQKEQTMPDTSPIYHPTKPQNFQYLDCGILHNGFARVKCGECGHEYLLAFSCKRRHFCPSCHQKRVVEFGEWLCEEVLKAVPHRHFVFSIPKILRRYFLYDRKLLSKGKITEDLVDMLMKWRHSGFNVFCGSRIQPGMKRPWKTWPDTSSVPLSPRKE